MLRIVSSLLSFFNSSLNPYTTIFSEVVFLSTIQCFPDVFFHPVDSKNSTNDCLRSFVSKKKTKGGKTFLCTNTESSSLVVKNVK